MLLNTSFPFTTSYRVHILIGITVGSLLGFILIFLQPFNINNFDHSYKEILFMGFGLIKFVNYMGAHFVENYFYKRKKTWVWWNEVMFLILSSISGAIFGYLYLDIVFEKQPLSLFRLLLFCSYIVLPVLPLIIFPKLVLRYFFSKNSIQDSQEIIDNDQDKVIENITLVGDNHKDEFTIPREQLLYVKSVDNYVMVFYKSDTIQRVMLRGKLSAILTQAPFLIQPHRSYLINPKHVFVIKGNSQKATLISKEIEEAIPIARTSYKTIKNVFN